jgi:hypothetical protein
MGWTARVRFQTGTRFSSSPERLWSPLSLLYNGNWEQFPWEYRGRGVKLTTHLHLVSRLRMMEMYFHSTIRLSGVVLNELSTRTTLLEIYRPHCRAPNMFGSLCFTKSTTEVLLYASGYSHLHINCS